MIMEDLLIISLFLFELLLGCLFLRLRWKRVALYRSEMIPVVGIAVLLFMHLVLPILRFLAKDYFYQSNYSTGTMLRANLAFLFFLGAFVIGLRGKSIEQDHSHLAFQPSDTLNALELGILLITFLVAARVGMANVSAISSYGVGAYLQNRIAYSRGQGVRVLIAHWQYVSVIGFFALFLTCRKGAIKVIAGVLGLGGMLLLGRYYAITGSRNSILIMLFSVWFALALSHRVPRWISLALALCGAPLLLFGFTAYGHYRGSYGDNLSLTTISSRKLIRSINRNFGNNEILLWLQENPQELLFGQTYLAGMANVVPRRFWPEKPLGGGPALKNMIYPDSYTLSRKNISSLTTGIVAELFMNFSFFGMFLGGWIYGRCLRRLTKDPTEEFGAAGLALRSLIATSCTIALGYSEFLGWLARFGFSALPLAGIISLRFVVGGLRSRQRNTNIPLLPPQTNNPPRRP
jgi:oligosaccharide repeat unit polymerase